MANMDTTGELNELLRQEAEKDEFIRTLNESEKELYLSATEKWKHTTSTNEAVHVTAEENRLLKREYQFRQQQKLEQFAQQLNESDATLLREAVRKDDKWYENLGDEVTRESMSDRERDLLKQFRDFFISE